MILTASFTSYTQAELERERETRWMSERESYSRGGKFIVPWFICECCILKFEYLCLYVRIIISDRLSKAGFYLFFSKSNRRSASGGRTRSWVTSQLVYCERRSALLRKRFRRISTITILHDFVSVSRKRVYSALIQTMENSILWKWNLEV